MITDERTVALQIVEVAKRLNNKGMLASADGNISYRVRDDRILITPSGLNKAFLTPEDMAVITLDGRVISGTPSGERLMHLEVYKQCDKARCVVHAHPPCSIAWSIANPRMKELPAECLSEVILAVGSIPIIPYARPGTVEMGTYLKPYLPQNRAMILARHGALTWGEDLLEAYNGMERVEHSALILKHAKEIGGLTKLPEPEVRALKGMRKKLGERIL